LNPPFSRRLMRRIVAFLPHRDGAPSGLNGRFALDARRVALLFPHRIDLAQLHAGLWPSGFQGHHRSAFQAVDVGICISAARELELQGRFRTWRLEGKRHSRGGSRAGLQRGKLTWPYRGGSRLRSGPSGGRCSCSDAKRGGCSARPYGPSVERAGGQCAQHRCDRGRGCRGAAAFDGECSGHKRRRNHKESGRASAEPASLSVGAL
jgi:hypothetical protein